MCHFVLCGYVRSNVLSVDDYKILVNSENVKNKLCDYSTLTNIPLIYDSLYTNSYTHFTGANNLL